MHYLSSTKDDKETHEHPHHRPLYPDLPTARAAAFAIRKRVSAANPVKLIERRRPHQDKLKLGETGSYRGLAYGIIGGVMGGLVTGALVASLTTQGLGASAVLGLLGAILLSIAGFILGSAQPHPAIVHAVEDLGETETSVMIEVPDNAAIPSVERVAESTHPMGLRRLAS